MDDTVEDSAGTVELLDFATPLSDLEAARRVAWVVSSAEAKLAIDLQPAIPFVGRCERVLLAAMRRPGVIGAGEYEAIFRIRRLMAVPDGGGDGN